MPEPSVPSLPVQVNVEDVFVVVDGGVEVNVTVGAMVSTMNVQLTGFEVPPPFVASTRKVWVPWERPV